MTTPPLAVGAGDVRLLPLAELHESPLNPRKDFDPVALKQLAENMLQIGQLTIGLCRPRPTGGYEIAAGHRRRRAAALGGIPTLRMEVRELDDRLFVEILNVENLQRDDLHPMEEAQGFRTLMETCGYDIPRIGERIGRERDYVYDRLKMLKLTKELQRLFRAGRFLLEHAKILARLSPDQQTRALGTAKHQFTDGGLLEVEHAHGVELEALEDPKDPTVRTKPRSPRELQHWIDRHIRFQAEKVDTPNLFPETAAKLAEAQAQKEKVVAITREYRVPDAARDGVERTYGDSDWRRADGVAEKDPWTGRLVGGKPCEHAVLGVLVAGPGRGDSFPVCVEKKKCAIHWPEEVKAAKAVASGKPSKRQASLERQQKSEEQRRQRYELQQARYTAERARFKKAAPALLEALGAAIGKAPVKEGSAVVRIVLGLVRESAVERRYAPKGTGLEAILRRVAFLVAADAITREWAAPDHAPKALKAWGIDAKKIVDQVAPAAAAEILAQKPKAKKLAGDVRRAKKKARGKGAA